MILMYHHVAPRTALPSASDRHPGDGWDFVVSPDVLSAQIGALLDKGLEPISLDDYTAFIKTSRRAPRSKFVITFDDGWRDNFEHAVPVLKSHSATATFFVISSTLREGALQTSHMNVAHLKILISDGMSVGSHSRSHPNLTQLRQAELVSEVAGSRHDLEDILGCNVLHFAYPGGQFDSDVVREVAKRYVSACTVYGPGFQTLSGIHMLYRDTLQGIPFGFKDTVKLSRTGRALLGCRSLYKVARDYHLK